MSTSTLWVLRKDQETIRCVIRGEPGREELQVFVGSELYITEVHTVHGGAIGRAETLRHGYEARGWVADTHSAP